MSVWMYQMVLTLELFQNYVFKAVIEQFEAHINRLIMT